MLKSLYVQQYALIEEVHITLAGGLNILTGETGAGKSILIGALGLILGERASTDNIRKGHDKAVIEGIFNITGNETVLNLLRENGYEGEDSTELIIRREIPLKGNSRAFINDSPAQLTLLREIGDYLVDLHGQHDHQMLLRPETHCAMLDSAGSLHHLLRDYTSRYTELVRIRKELTALRQQERELRQKQEFYRFQLDEIDEVAPEADEDKRCEQELNLLENSERIVEMTTSLYSLLYDERGSIRDKLQEVQTQLRELASFDETFNATLNECLSASVIIEEAAETVRKYSSTIEFSPERIEEIRERLLLLNGLRKKFGGTLDAVLAYREEIAGELDRAKHFDQSITALERQLTEKRQQAGKAAATLTAERKKAAATIEKAVGSSITHLGIPNGTFVILIDGKETTADDPQAVEHNGIFHAATPSGCDSVEFYISTNLGESPLPLAKIASGGEISRIMLALKSILATNEKLPILVFDEIDTGISGRIASKVGNAMRQLGTLHQIIAITHLPQIAAMSNDHFVVEKVEREGRTVTNIRYLTPDEHTHEVAKLMSGEEITESSLKMARELIAS